MELNRRITPPLEDEQERELEDEQEQDAADVQQAIENSLSEHELNKRWILARFGEHGGDREATAGSLARKPARIIEDPLKKPINEPQKDRRTSQQIAGGIRTSKAVDWAVDKGWANPVNRKPHVNKKKGSASAQARHQHGNRLAVNKAAADAAYNARKKKVPLNTIVKDEERKEKKEQRLKKKEEHSEK